jgi:hypothetical protein
MNPNDNQNSQQGGDAQATVQQVAGKALSFFRKNLIMTSVFSILFAVFIIGTIIIFFFGDVGGVAGGGGGGVNPLPIDGPGGVKQYIIIVDGEGTSYTDSGVTSKGVTLTPDQKNFIYDAFAKPLGSAAYKQLLSNSDGTPDPISLYFYPSSDSGASVGGGANYGGGSTMRYWGIFEFKDKDPNKTHQAMLEHILIHESGHIIDRRHGQNVLGMPVKSFNSGDGSNCYDTANPYDGFDFMKSYAFRGTAGENGGPQAEDFAEAIANNVFCAPGQDCFYSGYILNSTNIPNYPTTCFNTYNWIKQNVFGGDDFFAPPTSTDKSMCGGFYTKIDADNTAAQTSADTLQIAQSKGYTNDLTPRNIYLHPGENFGDPQCDLTQSEAANKAAIYTYLKQIDPKNADTWFNVIIPCESSFLPLEYSPNSHSTLGAYGLVQTNPGTNPYTMAARTGTSDIGDVPWKQQLQNGVNISAGITSFSAYWGCGSGITVIK